MRHAGVAKARRASYHKGHRIGLDLFVGYVVHQQRGQEEPVVEENEFAGEDWAGKIFVPPPALENPLIQLTRFFLKWNVILLLVWFLLEVVVHARNTGLRKTTDLSEPLLLLAGLGSYESKGSLGQSTLTITACSYTFLQVLILVFIHPGFE